MKVTINIKVKELNQLKGTLEVVERLEKEHLNVMQTVNIEVLEK